MALSVNQVSGNVTVSATANATATTPSITTVATSLLIWVATVFNTAGALVNGDVLDNKGNSWTLIPGSSSLSGANVGIGAWYNNNGTRGSGHTVSGNLTGSAGEFQNGHLIEILGQDLSSPIDSITTATSTDATSAYQVTAAGAIVGNQIGIYATVNDSGSNSAFTAPAGYTNIINQPDGTGFLVGGAWYKINETGTPSPGATSAHTGITTARNLFISVKEASSATTPVFQDSWIRSVPNFGGPNKPQFFLFVPPTYEVTGASLTLSQALETDTVIGPLVKTKTFTFGRATETDTGRPASLSKVLTFNRATETDTGRGPFTFTKGAFTLGRATETDIGRPLSLSKLLTLGRGLETDTGRPLTLTKVLTFSRGLETDTGRPLTNSKLLTFGRAFDTETGRPLSYARQLTLGRGIETDTGRPLTGSSKAFTTGRALETDTGRPLSLSKLLTFGRGIETDTGLPFQSGGSITLGRGNESDTGQPLSATKVLTFGLASEADTGRTLSLSKTVTTGRASEADTGRAITKLKTLTFGRAIETDLGRLLSFTKGVFTFGRATETDTAAPVVKLKTRTLGTGNEADTGRAFIRSKNATIGRAIETDTAFALVIFGGGPIDYPTNIGSTTGTVTDTVDGTVVNATTGEVMNVTDGSVVHYSTGTVANEVD
jgi:hypothetical protein